LNELKGWIAYAKGRHIYVQNKGSGECKNLLSINSQHLTCNFQLSHERKAAELADKLANFINTEIEKA